MDAIIEKEMEKILNFEAVYQTNTIKNSIEGVYYEIIQISLYKRLTV
jgi:hypothetical protein